MSATVKYKGQTLGTVSNTTKKLTTKGMYCEDDIEITDSGGGGSSLLYPLEYASPRGDGLAIRAYNNVRYSCINSHIRFENTGSTLPSSQFINLTDVLQATSGTIINNLAEWFEIPVGTAVLSVSNVTNASNLSWNMNFRQAGASTSLGFGMGDNTHLSGETVSVNVTSAQSVGCLFIYIGSAIPKNGVLEFDISFTVNGVRYF